MNFCPCCSERPYSECCQPFHKGLLPKTPLELMRSRYTAYALNLPEYIIVTTHPANPHYSMNTAAWKASLAQFSQNTLFQKLEILKHTPSTVTFTAHLLQNGRDATFTEKSYFEKIGPQWLYHHGE